MAVYKVPQDVEAEDKLIGPFSFRQFIYLIIAALGIFLAYLIGRLFWGLALIPVPVIIFFLVLALPLKKDQPMETYLSAIVRFLLKPRTRMWDPEGNVSLVEITALATQETRLTKDFSGHEASQRLQYLSRVVDTGGWASRGVNSPLDNLGLNDTVVAEAQGTEDMFDSSSSVAQTFNMMITKSDEARKQAMINAVRSSAAAPAATATAATQTAPAAPQIPLPTSVTFNPYPSSIHQRVISPTPQRQAASHPTARPVAQNQAQASSEQPVSPDIMRLATNKDLSISTIAREAERLQKKHLEDEEVVVSLR